MDQPRKRWCKRLLLVATVVGAVLVLFPCFRSTRGGWFDSERLDLEDDTVYSVGSEPWSREANPRGFLLTGPFFDSPKRAALPADRRDMNARTHYIRARGGWSKCSINIRRMALEVCTVALVTIITLAVVGLWPHKSPSIPSRP